jgi:hypothetical protein
MKIGTCSVPIRSPEMVLGRRAGLFLFLLLGCTSSGKTASSDGVGRNPVDLQDQTCPIPEQLCADVPSCPNVDVLLQEQSGSEFIQQDVVSSDLQETMEVGGYAFVPAQGLGWTDLGLPQFMTPSSLVLSPSGDRVYVAFFAMETWVDDYGTPLGIFGRDPDTGLLDLEYIYLDSSPINDSHLWAADELAMDPEGEFLFVLRAGGIYELTVFRLDAETGAPELVQEVDVVSLGAEGTLTALAISPDRKNLYVGGMNSIAVYDFLPTGESPVVFSHASVISNNEELPGPRVNSLSFDLTGKLLFGYLHSFNSRWTVWHRDTKTGELPCQDILSMHVAPFVGPNLGSTATSASLPHVVFLSAKSPVLQVVDTDVPAPWGGIVSSGAPQSCDENDYEELSGLAVTQVVTFADAYKMAMAGPSLAMAAAPDGTIAFHMVPMDAIVDGSMLNGVVTLVSAHRQPSSGDWQLKHQDTFPPHCGKDIAQVYGSNKAVQFSPDSRFVYSAGFHCAEPADSTDPIVFVHERIPFLN